LDPVTLEVGAEAPRFELRNQMREQISLDDMKGSKIALVFIPFAFTSTCEGELCEIRDNFEVFEEAEAKVVAITCDTTATNARWAAENGFEFDILSDFWPHGEVSRRYDTFNEKFGYAERTTYFIDEAGTITDLIRSDQLREARPFAHYEAALRG
jgi:peroxiredoxin